MKRKIRNTENVFIGVRISKDIKDALTKMAEEDTRTVSSLIHKILKEYLASEKK